MCGRYASARSADALIEEFEVDESLVDSELAPDYNVAPTKQVYAIVGWPADESSVGVRLQRQLRVVRWGLVPSWAKDPSIGSRLINARSETLADKPAFRRAFAKRRCLVPADGYYEWYAPQAASVDRTAKGKPRKQPFFIHRADGGALAMAGLYEWWHDDSRDSGDPGEWLLTATIITTAATDAVGRIHDRMPVVISPDDWARWLDPRLGERALVEAMMAPAMAASLDAYPVSVRVNNVRNNGSELIRPLPMDEALPGSVGASGFWPGSEL